MIIPEFWAEARIHLPRSKTSGQLTVRRFGWSETSQAEAQALAEARAAEALKRIQTGERLVRREHKEAYNGATGTPIREEVLARHGTTVITRNSYGAHCLNTPQVLFADIDFEGRGSSGFWLKLVLGLLGSIGLMLAYPPHSFWGFALSIVASFVIVGLLSALINAVSLRLRGGKENIVRAQIDKFVARHPEMMLRLYRTPAGFRLLAMHALFDPCSEEVPAFSGNSVWTKSMPRCAKTRPASGHA